MKTIQPPEKERTHSLNGTCYSRRNFIASCSACAACLALKPLNLSGMENPTSGPTVNMKIKILYALHEPVQSKPDWPNVGFDFRPVMSRINSALKKRFPLYEFIPVLAVGPEDTEKIIAGDEKENINGYIVYQMNCWNRVVQSVAKTGKPVLYADFQFGGSGGFLVYSASFINAGTENVGIVASSRMEDLLAAAGCFEIIRKGGTAADFAREVSGKRIALTPAAGRVSLKTNKIKSLSPEECSKKLAASKILAVRDQNSSIAAPVMGIPVEFIPFSEVNEAWSSADKDESAQVAGRWKKEAQKITGVSDETLATSAAMYLGMKKVLKDHNAGAITMNCLGGFYGGHIHAYPCLGFFELNNEGLVGACECDVSSTAAMVAFSTLTQGRAGFISDPVIDTSKRQIIYAHCVAPNRVFGPQGSRNPFSIMTHSEDRNGASVRSVLPVNYMTTTVQVNEPRKEILFHQAAAVSNDPDERACRTKLCASPAGDLEKLFRYWDKWGWHRVTFYGDLKDPVYALAGYLGWKIIEEA